MPFAHLPEGELADALRALSRVFWVIGAFSCAINLLLLAPSLYMLQTYDRVLTSRNEGTLLFLTLLLVGLLALEAVLEFVRSRVLVRMTAALDLQFADRVFDGMFQLAKLGQAGPTRALSDLGHLRQFLTGKGLLAFFDAPWVPVYLLVTFLLSPWLGLFSLLSAIVLIGMAWYNEQATAELHLASGRRSAAAGQRADATLRNAEVIEALGMLRPMRERWLDEQRAFLAVHSEANDRGAKVSGAVRFVRTALQSSVLGFGAYLVLQNQLTPGSMIAASILLGRTLAPVDTAIGSWRSVVAARSAFSRLNELLARFPVASHLLTLPRPQGAVSAEALVVGAPGKREAILRGITFQVGAGKMIAVVGPSASGKSTLARALVGVWPALAGTVRLDGADIVTWDREQLGPWLGYLPQDVELFDGTVAENIARFGVIDSEKVVEAARRAGVHELILHLPQGYETVIGAGGLMLSGGQRQRLALARALYGDPMLVVLDEPNANLDEAGDTALLGAIRDLKARQRTVFVVTHRGNLLTEADGIMVMGEGRVQAFGSPQDILKSRGRIPAQPAAKLGDDAAASGPDAEPGGQA
jgi:ATP-binding cassette subfamily C exporter for protease/lipase